MCEPATLGLTATQLSGIGTAVSVLSFGVQALSQIRQGDAQAEALKRQSQAAEFNARVAENNAILARQAAEADADTIDRQRRIALSKQSTGFAASGVVIDEGSTLEVLGDTAAEFELDRLNRLHQGQVQTNAQRIQSTLDRNNAQGLLSQASSARSAGRTAALGTVLTGAARTANTFSSLPSRANVNAPFRPGSLSGLSQSQQIRLSGLPGGGF